VNKLCAAWVAMELTEALCLGLGECCFAVIALTVSECFIGSTVYGTYG
jgi:hypothetical protein